MTSRSTVELPGDRDEIPYSLVDHCWVEGQCSVTSAEFGIFLFHPEHLQENVTVSGQGFPTNFSEFKGTSFLPPSLPILYSSLAVLPTLGSVGALGILLCNFWILMVVDHSHLGVSCLVKFNLERGGCLGCYLILLNIAPIQQRSLFSQPYPIITNVLWGG